MCSNPLPICKEKSVLKLRHENEAFLALIWRGRRQWGGLPESSDSAENGEWPQSRPAPPAGVRRILRATPSAAGPFWLLAVAILRAWCLHWGTISAPREQPSIHLNIPCLFSPQMPLGEFGAFFLAFRDSLFARQEPLGGPF